jgi:hypothetical protein
MTVVKSVSDGLRDWESMSERLADHVSDSTMSQTPRDWESETKRSG